jgi:hypothetical protein
VTLKVGVKLLGAHGEILLVTQAYQ